MPDLPPTRKLYREDSYQRSFEATVLAASEPYVILNQSLFYATAGGQPHDEGALTSPQGRAQVIAVTAETGARGDILKHQVTGVLPKVGDRVSGEIDWARRYRHMQRHSAQHLLSQAFVRLNERFKTVSVTLSKADCDLDIEADLSLEVLEEVENLVNEVAYQNLKVTCFEVAEIERYPLRRAPKVSGKIRLVDMGGWELSACGGTHVAQLAETLPIKILGKERVKGKLTRIYFRAGLEALEDYALKHDMAQQSAMLLSSQVADLPEKLAALLGDLKEESIKRSQLEMRLAEQLAAGLIAEVKPILGHRAICYALSAEDSHLASALAKRLIRHPKVMAALR
ncbi:MAG: alanyl-tRNA editing protein [Deinococcales bacterium]